MEFMAFSVGVLALVCALVLLFGAQGARRVLAWSGGIVATAAAATVGVVSWINYQPNSTTRAPVIATPLEIFPEPPGGSSDLSRPGKITVSGPDKRVFVFEAGTDSAGIREYMLLQYGHPGSPRALCWSKEPGPWCAYRQ